MPGQQGRKHRIRRGVYSEGKMSQPRGLSTPPGGRFNARLEMALKNPEALYPIHFRARNDACANTCGRPNHGIV